MNLPGAQTPSSSGLPSPGERYGDFHIQAVLGVGAFAHVFKASRIGWTEPVALKISTIPVIDRTSALRAEREVRILERLAVPHVVKILDHGLGPDDRWYLVMELLRGHDLGEHFDFAEPVEMQTAVHIIHQACLGLAPAHRAGIVHRDIKPRNLWMLPDGTVKVLDFGLARSWGHHGVIGANATAGHVLVGTPHYAQPEQMKTGKLTPASDVYSLAFLLYELLTTYTPLFPEEPCNQTRRRLANDPLEWLTAHVQCPAVPLEHYPVGARLPKPLRNVVRASLSKDPTDRPANAGDLATHLAWLLPPELGGCKGLPGMVLEESPSVLRARRFMLEEGSHRIGVGDCCDIQLAPHRTGWVYAVIDAKPGGNGRIRPMRDDGFVRVDGVPITSAVALTPGSTIHLGHHQLGVHAALE